MTTLGKILKDARLKSGMSATLLAKKIGFSRAYLSSVENDIRTNASDEFINKYLENVTDDIDEYNFYLSRIISDAEYKTNLKPVGKLYENSLHSSFFDAFNAPNVLTLQKGNTMYQQHFDEPLNDLKFHLKDLRNKKYYNSIVLDPSDLEYITGMIENYLEQKFRIQINVIENRYKKGDIPKLVHDEYVHDTQKIIGILGSENPY